MTEPTKLKEWIGTLSALLQDCPCVAEIVFDEEHGVVVVDMASFEQSGADHFDSGEPGVYAYTNGTDSYVHPTGEWDDPAE